jgi:hypothetical protein
VSYCLATKRCGLLRSLFILLSQLRRLQTLSLWDRRQPGVVCVVCSR